MADESTATRRRSPVRALRWLDHLLGGVSSVGAVISGVLLMGVTLMTIFDVIQRKFLPTSIPGVIEISTLLMLFVVYAAVGYTQRTGRHVSMSLVVDRLGPKAGRALHVAGMLLAILITGWMVQATGSAAWESFQTGEMSYGAVSYTVWPYRAIVCIGLALFLIEMIASVLRGDERMSENYEDSVV